MLSFVCTRVFNPSKRIARSIERGRQGKRRSKSAIPRANACVATRADDANADADEPHAADDVRTDGGEQEAASGHECVSGRWRRKGAAA